MMEWTHGKILNVDIYDEMTRSYMDYAMSVIVSRALPDVRDGLKPVHRRILWAMHELGMGPDKPHKKSARVVGEVLGKYHPHGDMPVYDAVVRLVQDFSSRYPLIDGHGNFGSVDGDAPAAMRYTEVRLAKIATQILRDIDKETVDFTPNFDETLEEPVVLPSRFPNLMVNGSSGIAVGMATSIPPHNLPEVIDAIKALIDNPELSVTDLMHYIKGPDFPTGGLILGKDGIRCAYETGKGIITMRAVAAIDTTKTGKNRIVVTELPFQANKAKLIEHIAELVRDKKIEGVSDLRDETDRTGLRIVIEVKKDANALVLLNQLYRHTPMQQNFSIIMLALVNGQPRILNLKSILSHYIDYQKDIIVRRTKYELAKAEARAHILEGLLIALANLDRVIKLIRSSSTVDEARDRLMSEFKLSEKQAQAILDMRLQRLTALEREKIDTEHKELLKSIEYLKAVLASEKMVLNIIKHELSEIQEKFGDRRRTRIVQDTAELDSEDLIADEDVVVALTHNGYIKRSPVTAYRSQKRGGRGSTGIHTRAEDFVEHLFITTAHHNMLFFTNKGKVYRIKAHEIPEMGRQAKGTAVVNLLPLDAGEGVTAVIPVRDFNAAEYLVMATARGLVKKTRLEEYHSSRKFGLVAIDLLEDDELIGVKLTDGNSEIMLITEDAQCIRFHESEVRPMGRNARGVTGIRLSEGDRVVAMEIAQEGAELLTLSRDGYGKRTPVSEYRPTSRSGKGIKTMDLTRRGRADTKIAGAKVVKNGDEVMIISAAGYIIRTAVEDIRTAGRGTKGVLTMKLEEGDSVVSMAQVSHREDDE
ncbi:MAG: DNA gyrase subunit A [Bacillota bacterium]